MFMMRFVGGVALAAAALVAASSTAGADFAGAGEQLGDLEEQFYDIKVTRVGGTFATLRFKSKDALIPFVAVGETQLTPAFAKGSWDIPNPKRIKQSVFPLLTGPRTVHEITVINLAPGRDHWVTILPKGNQIKKERLPGFVKFRTLHRQLRVSFERIEMIDDSDDLSDGDFGFDFLILSNSTVVWKKEPAVVASIGSGKTRTISVQQDVTFDDDEVKIGVTGIDNDIDGFTTPGIAGWLELGKFGKGMAFPTSGHHDDYEWASGWTRIPLGHVTQADVGTSQNVTETFSRSFTVSVDGRSKTQIRFKVHGLIKVWYE